MTEKPVPPRPGRGAQAARLAEILRVDHAGELAAVQIYRGQRAVMGAAAGKMKLAGHFAEMEAQEAEHLARFDRLLTERRVRPTALAPVWRLAGFALIWTACAAFTWDALRGPRPVAPAAAAPRPSTVEGGTSPS